MSSGKDNNDKFKPADKNKLAELNKLTDESNVNDRTLSDSPSGNNSLPSDTNHSSGEDIGHDFHSTLNDATSNHFSENDISSNSDSTNDSSDKPSISSSDNNYENHCRSYSKTDDEKNTKSDLSRDNSVDKEQLTVVKKRLRERLLIYKTKRHSQNDTTKSRKISISLYEKVKKESMSTEGMKKKFSTHISKDIPLSTDNTDHTSAIHEKVLRSLDLEEYSIDDDLVKEYVAALIKLAIYCNFSDFISAINVLLKDLESKLDNQLADRNLANFVRNLPETLLLTLNNTALEKQINDHVYDKETIADIFSPRFSVVSSDTNDHQSDHHDLESIIENLSKTGKKISSFEEKLKYCKHLQSPVDPQCVSVMYSGGDPNGNDDQENQDNQVGNQENEIEISGNMADQEGQDNPQASEDAGATQQLSEEEEGANEEAERVSQVPRPFYVPRNSVLITLLSHLVENQHMIPVNSQCWQFFAKGITVQTLMKFLHTGVGCVHYNISEVLSSIVVVTDNAEKVFEFENIYKAFSIFIEEALKMLVTRPIPVTEINEDFPVTTPSMSTSYMHSRCDRNLRDIPLSETTNVHHVIDTSKVTCHPTQDTDRDEDDAVTNSITLEWYRSAPACHADKNEDFELIGCTCGVSKCEGETIARKMRRLLESDDARCSVQRDHLLITLTALVNFNTRPNCILGILRMQMLIETVQRNSVFDCLDLQPLTRHWVVGISKNAEREFYVSLSVSRAQHSISSLIDSHSTNLSSVMATRPIPLGQHDISLSTMEDGRELQNMQNWIGRLCSQLKGHLSDRSTLASFIKAMTNLEHLSSHVQKFIPSLLHTQRNSLLSKLSISITVVPDGVPTDHLSRLLDNHVTFRDQDNISGLLYMPPLGTTNNVPLIVSWTLTMQPSLLQMAFDSIEPIDPVEAVDLSGKESLVAAFQSAYSNHDGGEVNNTSDEIVTTCVGMPNHNDRHNSNHTEIFTYFHAENSSYGLHPSVSDTVTNNNEISCEPVKATTPDDDPSSSEGQR